MSIVLTIITAIIALIGVIFKPSVEQEGKEHNRIKNSGWFLIALILLSMSFTIYEGCKKDQTNKLETDLLNMKLQNLERSIHRIDKIRIQYTLKLKSTEHQLDEYIAKIYDLSSQKKSFVYKINDSTMTIRNHELYPKQDSVEGIFYDFLNSLSISLSFVKTNKLDSALKRPADFRISYLNKLTETEFNSGNNFSFPSESIFFNPKDSTFKLFVKTEFANPSFKSFNLESLDDFKGCYMKIDFFEGFNLFQISPTYIDLICNQGPHLEMPIDTIIGGKYIGIIKESNNWK